MKGTFSATAEAYVEAAARQRLRQRDQQRLRDSSSPRWKEHYALVSSKWGSMATTSTTSGFISRVPNTILLTNLSLTHKVSANSL